MQKVLTAEEMREVDRLTTEKYGIPSILLMENAAQAAARVIVERLGGSVRDKTAIVLCGKGNNGGDGAALARILWLQGMHVNVLLWGRIEDTKGDARRNFEIAKKLEGEGFFLPGMIRFTLDEIDSFDEFREATSAALEDLFVDALFGTGLSRPVEGELRQVIGTISHWQPRGRAESTLIVSLDLPSGLDADSNDLFPVFPDEIDSVGDFGSATHPDLTITFTAPKPANVLAPAYRVSSELNVVPIGSPEELVADSPSKLYLAEKEDARSWAGTTFFQDDSYKNKRGHALLIAGSKDYAGAAVLCGNAAIRSGVGLVTVATPESAHETVASRVLPEVMVRSLQETPGGALSEAAFPEIEEFWKKIDAVAIGSGLSSDDESTGKFVREVVRHRRTPMVIDADALNLLAPFELKGSDELPLILTPHEGEFLRLLGTTDKTALKDRVAAAREFAQTHNVILVLKGERALIAGPDGVVVVNPTGNSGLGKAGNGDTLTGIITGFIAQSMQFKKDVFEAVVAAVYIAGMAGDIAESKYGKRVMTASDVRECLAEAFEELS